MTRAYSPLKSTSSTVAFNHQKQLWWNLSISLASDPTCSWILLWSVVNYSVASQVKFLSHENFCRARQVTWGGRAQVVSRLLIGHKSLQISRRSVASVSRRLGRDFDSWAWVYADRLTNGVQGSRPPKSVVVRSQVILITWLIIHLCFLVCRSLPKINSTCKSVLSWLWFDVNLALASISWYK